MDEIFIENIRLKEQIATIERMLKKSIVGIINTKDFYCATGIEVRGGEAVNAGD